MRRLRITGLAAVLGLALATLSPVSASAVAFQVTAAVGDNPTAMVLSSDGTTLFVANLGDGTNGTISVMDVTNPLLPVELHRYDLGAITGQTAYPFDLLLSSDGNQLYVADAGTNQVHDLDVSNRASPSLRRSILVGAGQKELAWLGSEGRIAVTGVQDASLVVITVASDWSVAADGPY